MIKINAIGKPIDRVDGRLKVTGAAKYAAEFNQPQMAYAFPVRSTIAKGTIAGFDKSVMEQSSGVIAVLTYENAPRLRAYDRAELLKIGGILGEQLATLQDNKIHYFGQFISVVVAATNEQARCAAALLKVTYAKEKPRIDLKTESPNGTKPEKFFGREAQVNTGKAAPLLAAAPVKIEQTYTTSTENHHPMEPLATVAVWEGADKLTLYDPTQGVLNTRGIAAYFLKLKPENVRVISPYVGGGFGSKGQWTHDLLAAMAAQVVKRPVKLVITRQMMQTNVGRRSATIQKVALATDRNGKLTVIRHHSDSSNNNLTQWFESCGILTGVLYNAPLREITHRVTNLDLGASTYMRAPGEAPGSFALESAMDEMAYEMKIDPVELRA